MTIYNGMLRIILVMAVALTCSGLTKGETTSSSETDPPIILMTYNILLETSKAEGYKWDQRKGRVIDLIKKYQVEILCAQEDWFNQGKYIIQETDYGKIGVSKMDGTADGDRAHVSIYYAKNRFDVLSSGHFWLSATPERPSQSWEAESNRICNWAKFNDKQSGKQFYVFNTHLDHTNNEARINSANLIVQKIKEIAGDSPVILTGDMNAKPGSEPINIFRSYLADSKDISSSPHEGPVGTYNRHDINFKPENPIDYIFLSNQFSVSRHKTVDDSENGLYPSDHFPVLVKLQINR